MVHPRFPPAAAGFIHADARFVDNHVHTGRARSPDSKNIHKSSSCLPVESTHSLETNPAALVTSENVRLATIPVRDPHGSNRAKLTNRSSTPTTAHLHFLDTKRRFQSPVADTHPLAKAIHPSGCDRRNTMRRANFRGILPAGFAALVLFVVPSAKSSPVDPTTVTLDLGTVGIGVNVNASILNLMQSSQLETYTYQQLLFGPDSSTLGVLLDSGLTVGDVLAQDIGQPNNGTLTY